MTWCSFFLKNSKGYFYLLNSNHKFYDSYLSQTKRKMHNQKITTRNYFNYGVKFNKFPNFLSSIFCKKVKYQNKKGVENHKNQLITQIVKYFFHKKFIKNFQGIFKVGLSVF